MSDLNIRNVPETLIQALKVEAAETSQTLREVCIERLSFVLHEKEKPISAPPRKTVPARKKSNGELSAHDEKRMAELNSRFDEHIRDEMEKPSRLARVMAAVPEVRPAVEVLAPDSRYQRPGHSIGCRCLMCFPPASK